MCGRYTLIRSDQILRVFQNITVKVDLSVEVGRWNIAPTQGVLILAGDAKGGGVVLENARWGLIPSWAKDASIGNRMINARAETLAEKPAFRTALKRRRCGVLADGFYEWRKNTDGTKTPMHLRLKSQGLFAFAGLWETWSGPTGEDVLSCTIITTGANALAAPIHERMPVILLPEEVDSWVMGSAESATELLRARKPEEMEAFAVGKAVNRPGNDGPELVAPVPDALRATSDED